MDLLAADTTARVDPSKRMLAGLSPRQGRLTRRRLASVLAAGAVVGLFMLSVTMYVQDDGAILGVNDGPLPSIPFEAAVVSAFDVPTFFKVSKSALHEVIPLGTTFAETPSKPAGARKARRSATKATSLDVAILSVLVEHIDAERRADRPTKRDMK
jgi:hypothetical protein